MSYNHHHRKRSVVCGFLAELHDADIQRLLLLQFLPFTDDMFSTIQSQEFSMVSPEFSRLRTVHDGFFRLYFSDLCSNSAVDAA